MEDIKLHKNEIELIKSCLETCKSFNIGTGLYDRIIKKMNKALPIHVVVGTLVCPECSSKDCRKAIHTDYVECNKCFHYWGK